MILLILNGLGRGHILWQQSRQGVPQKVSRHPIFFNTWHEADHGPLPARTQRRAALAHIFGRLLTSNGAPERRRERFAHIAMNKNFTIRGSGWVTCPPHAFELAPRGVLTRLRLSTEQASLDFRVGAMNVTVTFEDVVSVTLRPGPSWDVYVAGEVLRAMDDDAFLVEGPSDGVALWLNDGGLVRVIAGFARMEVG